MTNKEMIINKIQWMSSDELFINLHRLAFYGCNYCPAKDMCNCFDDGDKDPNKCMKNLIKYSNSEFMSKADNMFLYLGYIKNKFCSKNYYVINKFDIEYEKDLEFTKSVIKIRYSYGRYTFQKCEYYIKDESDKESDKIYNITLEHNSYGHTPDYINEDELGAILEKIKELKDNKNLFF